MSTNTPAGADRRPLDANGRPLPKTAQPGYYPGFSTLSQEAFWDEATRRVVRTRVETVAPIRFFTESEARLLGAMLDRIVPQDDRDEAHRIPILSVIDDRLFDDRIDGYRFEDMPSDQEAYRQGLPGIDLIAQHLFDRPFTELEPLQQDTVLWTMHDDQPPAGQDIWKQVPADRFWLLIVQDAVDAYYAHPYAWDEVGFGGPSYPRGYFRLERGQPEPWEVREQRYEWSAPPTSSSGEFRKLGGRTHHGGQEGTH